MASLWEIKSTPDFEARDRADRDHDETYYGSFQR